MAQLPPRAEGEALLLQQLLPRDHGLPCLLSGCTQPPGGLQVTIHPKVVKLSQL